MVGVESVLLILINNCNGLFRIAGGQQTSHTVFVHDATCILVQVIGIWTGGALGGQ